jgi:flap endonuclease-1
MGIRGLNSFLKWKVPNARTALVWSKYSGQTWGIDCSCILYRARAENLSPITVLASLLVRMRQAGIRAICIFDGRPPTAKSETVEQRRAVREAAHKEMADIRSDMSDRVLTITEKATMEGRHAVLQKKAPVISGTDKDDVKNLLYAAGVQFVTAYGEADDVLAYLCRTAQIQAVISTDMDMLARGVPLLVVPETHDCSVLTAIRTAVVLSGLGLTQEMFVDACVLMGSDYAGKGSQPMDPKAAIAMAQKGVDWTMYDPKGRDLLLGSNIQWTEIVSEKQRAKWDLGAPPHEKETLAELVTLHRWPATWCTILGSAP